MEQIWYHIFFSNAEILGEYPRTLTLTLILTLSLTLILILTLILTLTLTNHNPYPNPYSNPNPNPKVGRVRSPKLCPNPQVRFHQQLWLLQIVEPDWKIAEVICEMKS